MAIDTSY